MIHLRAIFIFSLVGTVHSDTPKLTLVAEPSDTKLMWHTDLTLECTWDASAVPKRAHEDMLVDGISVWYHKGRYYKDDPSKKIEVEEAEGKLKIVVKDLTAADSGAKFQCSMSLVGVSEIYTLDVLEPPSGQPNYINIEPNFEDAKVTFANVDGAIKYKVGYQADQTADWTETEITETAVTLTGLSVATKYTVRVEPGNEAGYRSDADTVDIKSNTFTTKDNQTTVTISRVGKNPLKCKVNSRSCKLRFKVKASQGKVTKNNVKICKVVNGERKDCKNSQFRKKSHTRSFGKNVEAAVSGTYVCVVNLKGKETVSSPVTVKVE